MPAPKTDAEKALQGTLRKCRVKAPRSIESIQRDVEFVKQAVDAMEYNLHLASDAIAKGVMVSTTIADRHGKTTQVERLNPAFRIQRDSLRLLLSLRKQVGLLEAELAAGASTQSSDEDDEWKDF